MKRKITYIIKSLILSVILLLSSAGTCKADVDTGALQDYLNGVVSQRTINQSNNPKYADRSNSVETIDPLTGNLLLKETDLYLPGKDGLDFTLGRIYNSSQDEYDNKVTINYIPQYYDVQVQRYVVVVLTVDDNHNVLSYYRTDPYPTYDAAAGTCAYYDSLPNCDAFIDPVWVTIQVPNYIVEFIHGPDRYSYNKTRYNLGAGWSFGFPSVQIEGSGDNKTLIFHDGSGSAYEVTGTSESGTTNLKDYQGKNVKFLEDSGSYVNSDNISSKYKFIDSNLTTTYFAADGRLLCIKDRYNNEIKFKHQMVQIYDKSYPLISQVTDTVGRIVLFSYTGNNIEVSVTAPNETGLFSLTYEREYLTQAGYVNGTYQSYQYPVLKCVKDPLGRETHYANYYNADNSIPLERYSYTTKDLSTALTIPRYLLGAVIYPGSKTIYEYEKVTRNLGADGAIDVYRVKSRHDEIQRKNNNTQVFEWITDNNRVNYTYSRDCSGYPTYTNEETMPTEYQFYSEATTISNGLKVRTTFNGSKQKIQEESIASNNEKKVVKYLTFDTNYKYLPTKIETSEYASDGTIANTYYSDTTYTDWGGISSSTVPLTLQQYNDSNLKAKYTTSYSYENATYKYFVTKKQWYQNESTLLDETYTYDADGKIATYKNAKGEIITYTYANDSTGNKVEEISQSLENGKTAKTRMIYGSETGYAFPKETISYYTDSQGAYSQTKTSMTYNMLFGQAKTKTDSQNHITTYTYDCLGRVKSIQLPDFTNTDNISYSVRQEYSYTDGYNEEYIEGNYKGIYGTTISSKTIYENKNTHVLSYYNQTDSLYDAYGNLRLERIWDGAKSLYINKSAYTYDNMQRVISAIDANGNILTQSYNPWGQADEATDASGNLYVSKYDIKSNKVISYFVARENIVTYRANPGVNNYKEDYSETYLDQFGRTVEKRVYENWPVMSGMLSELYQYDLVGNLISFCDPKRNLNEDGVTNSYRYDVLNRVVTVKDAKNQITSVNYTLLGNVSSVTLKENSASTTSELLYTKNYDELGNLMSKTDPSTYVTNYSYNSIGQNVSILDRNKSTTTMSYDGIGQLMTTNQTSSDNTSSITHKYRYNNPFGIDKEQLYINGTVVSSAEYQYNSDGSLGQKNITGSGYINSLLQLQYDNAGRMTSVSAGVMGSNYFYSNYKYSYDRLTKVQTNGLQAESASDSDNAVYDYYPDGKLKKITYPKLNDGTYLTAEYVYNPIGRLTAVTNKKNTTVLSQYRYTYDANGNISTINDGQTTKLTSMINLTG